MIVTNNVERADYAVILDHEGGKGALRHKNKIAVFNRDGDAIFLGLHAHAGQFGQGWSHMLPQYTEPVVRALQSASGEASLNAQKH